MSEEQAIVSTCVAIIGLLIMGVLFGHFVWGATLVEVQRVEYDVPKNTEACAKLGGGIVANFNVLEEYATVRFECVVPAKTIPFHE